MKEWLKVKWNPAVFTVISQDLLYIPKEMKKARVFSQHWIEEVRKSQKRIRIFCILNTIAVRTGRITV
jgi:hypothetical protein